MENATINIINGMMHAEPKEMGYRPDRIDALNRHFEALIKADKLQCAGYLLARDGKIFAHHTMGRLHPEKDSPVYTPDSIRRLASITKWFTAIGFLRLVEEGRIKLHEPVAKVLQEFDTEMHRDITMFHLLTHTSGLPADTGYYLEPYPKWWGSGSKPEDNWLCSFLGGPLKTKPGEEWCYSTTGFSVIGEVVARLTQKPFEQYIMDSIVRPLRMERTFYDVPDELIPEVCTVEEWDKGRLQRRDNDDGPPSAGSGLNSTLYDLYRFGQMCLNGGEFDGARIIGRKTLEAMTRNHLSGIPAFKWGQQFDDLPYGLGINYHRAGQKGSLFTEGTYSHEGAGRSGLFVDPKERFVAVFFVPTHSGVGWLPQSIIHTLNIIWSGIV